MKRKQINQRKLKIFAQFFFSNSISVSVIVYFELFELFTFIGSGFNEVISLKSQKIFFFLFLGKRLIGVYGIGL